MPADLIGRFAALFNGRRDVYGSDEGRCVREPVTSLLIEEHLTGVRPIGIYPVAHTERQAVCRWGCIDLDVKADNKPSGDYDTTDDAHTVAHNLVRTWQAFGVTAWIERTRSDGRHVWTFLDRWMPIAQVRDAQQVVCQVAGASAREINPKQRELAADQLGNYVRLPFAGNSRPILDADDLPMSVWQFVDEAEQTRADRKLIREIAALWEEPEPAPQVKVTVGERQGAGRVPASIWFSMNPKARAVYSHGPADGDRSDGMIYLAHQCRESGLTPSEAVVVLREVGWNKFAGRADEQRRLEAIVAQAWR